MEKLFLLLLIIFAISAIQTPKSKKAVIFLALFSLISSVIYLFYESPNIAIAEAAIGAAMSTVIYLIALKKQKQFNVYISQNVKRNVIDAIESFCEKEDLLFYYIKYKPRNYKHIKDNHDYELIVSGNEEKILLYSPTENYKDEELKDYLQNKIGDEVEVSLTED